MSIGVCLLGIFVAIANIIDYKSHNKKVDQTWPETYDHNSQFNFNMRDRFTVHYGGEYVFIIIFVICLIDQIVKEFNK